MAQIMLAYNILKGILTAMMMLYKNMKEIVRSPDSNTDFFDIDAGVVQRDSLVPHVYNLSR